MGKLAKILFLFSAGFLQSCFFGADGYEKNLNDFFWLFGENKKSVYLGTIEYSKYRILDKYLGPIKRIGWNKEHLIIQAHNQKYYIQELTQLQNTSTKDYEEYLHEYSGFHQFQNGRNQLKVDENLEFEIEY